MMIDSGISPDAREVLEKNSSFVSDNAQRFQEYLAWDKQYRVEPTIKRREVYSTTVVPEMFSEVEAISTAAFEMVFSDDTDAAFFSTLATSQEFNDLARNAQAVLVRQFEVMHFERKFLGFLRKLVLNGTGVSKIPWKYRKNQRGAPKEGPDFEIVNLLRFRYDQSAVNIDDAGWTATELSVSHYEAYAQALKGYWQNVGEAVARSKSDKDTYIQQKDNLANKLLLGNKTKELEVIEYYGTLESKKDNQCYRMTVTKDGIILREAELNPYANGEKPNLKTAWVDLGDEFCGLGIGKVNSRQQDEVNERRNLSLDALRVSLYHMWGRLSGSGVDDENLSYSPNKIIDMNMVGGIFPLESKIDQLVPAMRMEGMSKEDMMRASAASSTFQAIPMDITATETKAVHSEAVRRVKVMVRANVSSFLRDMTYKIHGYNLEYLENPILAEIIGENGASEFKELNYQNLPSDLRIKVKISTDMGSKFALQKNYSEFLTAVGALLQNNPRYRLNPMAAIEYAASLYNFNPKDFIQEIAVNQELLNQPLGATQDAMREMAEDGRQLMAEQGAV